MATVAQQGQTATGQTGGAEDFEQAFESVKIERNSKGVNFSYRIARHEGESWEDVFRNVDMVHSALLRRFGDQR